jgi:dihydrofolate synthase/folylpolyglutamate synthase
MYKQLPMYHRIGAVAYKTGLQTTLSLCKYLGNPQLQYQSVHIGGTNGKGSTSHLIASILQASGKKTGLYTSPHLKDFRERIKVNGRMVPKSYVTQFVTDHQEKFEKIHPSFFEMTFALAIQYFADCNIDVGVFEVGMGGRLDSTNIIKPIVSVITNISLDHTLFLGNTLSQIAMEKAGIIKNHTPVVIGESQEETQSVFISKAIEENSEISFADQHYHVRKIKAESDQNLLCFDIFHNKKIYLKRINCPLAGNYQVKNLCTVFQAVDVMNALGFHLSAASIRKGIQDVIRLTGLSGRWQVLRKKPLTICDTGHNEEGIKYVIQQIRNIHYKKLHFVIGMVNDKDLMKILRLLPKQAQYYFCRPNIPRGLDQQELATAAIKLGLNGDVFPSVWKAYQNALMSAQDDDLVFIGGSTFVVAEVL